MSLDQDVCSCLFIDHGDLDMIPVSIESRDWKYSDGCPAERRPERAGAQVPGGPPAGGEGGGVRPAGVPEHRHSPQPNQPTPPGQTSGCHGGEQSKPEEKSQH